ncbi:MAG: aspartate--tRNA ligase [Actinomycetota bacterium]
MIRTHGAGELRATHDGADVTLTGWVHHLRDHKGVVFVDLRDASGSVQVVFHDDIAREVHVSVDREFCVLIRGTVQKRKPGTENPKIPTGEVEVAGASLEVLSESQTPPFVIEDDLEADEATRLRYRYLDLRRPVMQRILKLRHKVIREIRAFLDARGFVEIETPILFKATPEGARDFLVPSRLQPGNFYALPQSPQILKQLSMVAGLERYYQIARCFRDEDARADRHLEFTQLDLEMSFVDVDDIIGITEQLYAHLWRECLGVEVALPFPRIPFAEAVDRFGSDHVDLRYGMELHDVHEVFADTQLGIFKKVLEAGGAIRAIAVPGAGDLPHAELKRHEKHAMERGAKGLAWVIFKENGEVDSRLEKYLSPEEREGLAKTLGAGPGDLVLIVADKRQVANAVLGSLRSQLARERGLVPENEWKFCWVVDYPFFEWLEDEKRWEPMHHPFTSPEAGWEDLIDTDPGAVRMKAYDIVLNGLEIASGSIRIHRPEHQRKIFEVLGIDEKTAEERFGFLLEAFRYGPPPHGGIAPGIERTLMRMLGIDNVREVIAYPKTGSGQDLMSGAPTSVDPKQLRDLGIKTVE